VVWAPRPRIITQNICATIALLPFVKVVVECERLGGQPVEKVKKRSGFEVAYYLLLY
jgi:hypothetical protein